LQAPDPGHPVGRCARAASGRCAAEQRDELAATAHSITSSARNKIDGGTVRPSALGLGVYSYLEFHWYLNWNVR